MTLLQTKLFAPQMQKNIVLRSRLLEKLNNSSSPIFQISAPAGSGKSTLISQWLHSYKKKYCWISLDELDNDIGRFLSYVIEAITPFFSDKEINTIQSTNYKIKEQLEVFKKIANLFASSSSTITIVFDDYHYISNKELISSVQLWLDYLPPQIQFIFISREELPFQTARLRSQHKIEIITSKELAFSFDEVSEFYNNIPDLSISDESKKLINEKTEGWVTGLQLSTLYLENNDQKSLQEFNGSIAAINQYFSEEIIAKLSKNMSSFLSATSILLRFNASLCDYVTEREDSNSIVEDLKQRQLFIIPLDENNTWYRYHHLLSTSFEKQLSENEKQRLYCRASDWCNENRYYEEAYRYACKAKRYDDAINIFDNIDFSSWGTIFESNSYSLLLMLPEEIRQNNVNVIVHLARELLMMDNYNEAINLLNHAQTIMQSPHFKGNRELYTGRISVLLVSIGHLTGDNQLIFNNANSALTLVEFESDYYWLCQSYVIKGGIELISGNLHPAISSFKKSCDYAKLHGSTTLTSMATFLWLTSLGVTGDINLIDKAINSPEIKRDQYHSPANMTDITYFELKGEIELGSGKIDNAIALFEEAFNQATTSSLIHRRNIYTLQVRLALASLMKRDYSYECIIDKILEDHEIMHWIHAQSIAYKGRLSIFKKDNHGVENWLHHTTAAENPSTVLVHNQSMYVLYGASLRFLKKIDLACNYLYRLTTQLYNLDSYYEGLEAHLLYVLCLKDKGDSTLFQKEITALFDKTFELMLFRHFYFWIADSIALIEEIHEKKLYAPLHKNLIPKILKELKTFNNQYLSTETYNLSDREIEVLTLVSKGYSNQEVSKLLYISLNTVKTHLKNINTKLDTTKRTEAVNLARELAII